MNSGIATSRCRKKGQLLDDLLERLQQDRSLSVIEGELRNSQAAYHYMEMLADAEEERGNPAKALEWLARAYTETEGSATKFRAGVVYIIGLTRMRAHDDAAIQDATLQVLGALTDTSHFYGRNATRLTLLDTTLRRWNADDRHRRTIEAVRARMGKLCERMPAEEKARATCEGFLDRGGG